jgi:hypothetical protein
MKERWKDISVKDKFQLINGTVCVMSSIVLYFIAFLITLTGTWQLVSGGAFLLGTGLAFFGITAYVRTQMAEIEIKVDKELRKIERKA